MKTPLQELHHWVSTELKLDGYEHRVILDKIESMLEKDKDNVDLFFVREFDEWIENEGWEFSPVLFNGNIKYSWVNENSPSQLTTKELYEIFIEYGRDNKIGQS